MAWVFPMDGTDVWPRTSPGGRPAVYRTRDAGRSWTRRDAGLPLERAWLTVLRAMLGDPHKDLTGTAKGRGILLRLVTGEPLHDLFADHDLADAIEAAAPAIAAVNASSEAGSRHV